jgi:hypothetical protein
MTDNDDALGHEVCRYCRGEDVRVYRLRAVEEGVELWRVTIRPGQPDHVIQEDRFTDVDAAVEYFEDIRRALTAGGWK